MNTDKFIILADNTRISKEAWLALRDLGIGGSDAAGCMGMSKYASPYTVVADKLKMTPAFTGNEATERGKFFEPVIFNMFPAWYEAETGEKITLRKYDFSLQSKEHEFMLANLDGLCIHPKLGEIGFEIKTSAHRVDWLGGAIPDNYYCQVQHYIAVTGLDYFLVAVLLLDGKGGFEFRYVPRNDDFIASMIKAEENVMEFINDKMLPEPSGTDSDVDAVNHIANSKHPRENLDHLQDTVERFQEVKGIIKALGAEEKQLSNKIKDSMTARGKAHCNNYNISFSDVTTSRFDAKKFKEDNPDMYDEYTKESSYAKLLIKGGKK